LCGKIRSFVSFHCYLILLLFYIFHFFLFQNGFSYLSLLTARYQLSASGCSLCTRDQRELARAFVRRNAVASHEMQIAENHATDYTAVIVAFDAIESGTIARYGQE
jgi:hypothetical protein